MKQIHTLIISGLMLGLMGTANATSTTTANIELAEKEMVIPVETVIEKLKAKQGFISHYTPLDSLVDTQTSKVFDSKSHNLKVQALKTVIDHIDKTYLYQTAITHTEVKSFPAKNPLNTQYLFSATFNNGDKLVYTIIHKDAISKVNMDEATLERTFMTEGVTGAFSNVLKKAGTYQVAQMDTVNKVNGFELIDLNVDNKSFRVVFKHTQENDSEVLFAMIKQKQ